MGLLYMLEIDSALICQKTSGVVQIFGYIYFFLKVATPITLLVVGMINTTKAITMKSEDEIQKAWVGLGKKAIAAVSVFLVATMVNVLVGGILNSTYYKDCAECFNKPFTACSQNK